MPRPLVGAHAGGEASVEEATLLVEAWAPRARAPLCRPPVACGALALLAVVAGVIATGPATRASSAAGRGPRQVRDISYPSQLYIEQNLTMVDVEKYNFLKSLEENINDAWDNFVQISKISNELTQSEMDRFEERFKEEVDRKGKNPFNLMFWAEKVAQALEEEKPIATKQFENKFRNEGKHSFEIKVHEWMVNISNLDLLAKCGDVEDFGPDAPVLNASEMAGQGAVKIVDAIPDDFNSATKWPDCAVVITRVHSQGACGSSWAFSVAGALDSRLCIATEGTFQSQLSRAFITSCPREEEVHDGCRGGNAWIAHEFLASHGAPTGGPQGCIAQLAHGDGMHHFADGKDTAPPCSTHCTYSEYFRSLDEDLLVLKEVAGSPWLPISPAYGHKAHPDWLKIVKSAVMDQGPIPVSVQASSNLFFAYASGVYDVCCDGRADHGVVMTGWGSQPAEHVIVLNSWGEWGIDDAGFMKMLPCTICHATITNSVRGDDHLEKIKELPSTPSPPMKTIWATEKGDSCVFPFMYSGYEFTECTSFLNYHRDHSLWCATKVQEGDMPHMLEWESCHEKEVSAIIFQVNSGPCVANNIEGCISRENYEVDETCEISVLKDVKLYTHEFSTEVDMDILLVDGKNFSGLGWHNGPAGISVTTSTEITWSSDYSDTSEGWKLCAREV